jgi:hypothetical protein
MVPARYEQELEDEIFRRGEQRGRVTTAISMLTDSLLMINALEIFYQKPSSKAVSPAQIAELRGNLDAIKELLRELLQAGENVERST